MAPRYSTVAVLAVLAACVVATASAQCVYLGGLKCAPNIGDNCQNAQCTGTNQECDATTNTCQLQVPRDCAASYNSSCTQSCPCGMVCAADKTCRMNPQQTSVGDFCTRHTECGTGLCGANRRCLALPSNTTCTYGQCGSHAYCDIGSPTPRCKPLPGAGEPCVFIGGLAVGCAPGTSCKTAVDLGSQSGTCVPYFSVPTGTTVGLQSPSTVCATGFSKSSSDRTVASMVCSANPGTSLSGTPCGGLSDAAEGNFCFCNGPQDENMTQVGTYVSTPPPPTSAIQATLQCAIDNGCYVGGVWKNPVSLNTGVAGMTYGLYQWGTCMNLKCSPVMARQACFTYGPVYLNSFFSSGVPLPTCLALASLQAVGTMSKCAAAQYACQPFPDGAQCTPLPPSGDKAAGTAAAAAAVAVSAAVTVAASVTATATSSVAATTGASVSSTVGSGAGSGVTGAAGSGLGVLALLVSVCQTMGSLAVISPKGMPEALRGFADAFQFSNLAVDLGALTRNFGSVLEVADTQARAEFGSNGPATAAVNTAAQAGVPAESLIGYVVTIVIIIVLVVVGIELLLWLGAHYIVYRDNYRAAKAGRGPTSGAIGDTGSAAASQRRRTASPTKSRSSAPPEDAITKANRWRVKVRSVLVQVWMWFLFSNVLASCAALALNEAVGASLLGFVWLFLGCTAPGVVLAYVLWRGDGTYMFKKPTAKYWSWVGHIPEEQTSTASYEERLEERRKAAVREAADAEREARLGAWNTITKPLVSGLRPEASYFWAVVAMYKVFKGILIAALAGVAGAAVFFTVWLEVGFLAALLLVVPYRDAFMHRVRVVLIIIGLVQLVCMLGLLSDDPDSLAFRTFVGAFMMLAQYVAMIITIIVALRGVALGIPTLKAKLPHILREDPAKPIPVTAPDTRTGSSRRSLGSGTSSPINGSATPKSPRSGGRPSLPTSRPSQRRLAPTSPTATSPTSGSSVAGRGGAQGVVSVVNPLAGTEPLSV